MELLFWLYATKVVLLVRVANLLFVCNAKMDTISHLTIFASLVLLNQIARLVVKLMHHSV